MKLLSIIRKSLLEQWRNYWIWILTISLAPFFVLIYSLITSSYAPRLDILILNSDRGFCIHRDTLNLGTQLENSLLSRQDSATGNLLTFSRCDNRAKAAEKIRNKEADLLLIIPESFSQRMLSYHDSSRFPVPVEFTGDLTRMEYMISAIWTYDLVEKYIYTQLHLNNPIGFRETPMGEGSQRTEFELAVPGLVIFAIIMLMFSASIAIVNETEKGTLIRLRMAPVGTGTVLAGISAVQVLLGIVSAFITLGVAAAMGFCMEGSFWLILFICILTSISVIAFSLILAAFARSANQILIVGNFPFFIFMFLSGAMFPLHITPWFTAGGYPVAVNSLLSPVHAVSALNKVIFYHMGFLNILPELISLVLLSAVYFLLGIWAFSKRHMGRR